MKELFSLLIIIIVGCAPGTSGWTQNDRDNYPPRTIEGTDSQCSLGPQWAEHCCWDHDEDYEEGRRLNLGENERWKADTKFLYCQAQSGIPAIIAVSRFGFSVMVGWVSWYYPRIIDFFSFIRENKREANPSFLY